MKTFHLLKFRLWKYFHARLNSQQNYKTIRLITSPQWKQLQIAIVQRKHSRRKIVGRKNSSNVILIERNGRRATGIQGWVHRALHRVPSHNGTPVLPEMRGWWRSGCDQSRLPDSLRRAGSSSLFSSSLASFKGLRGGWKWGGGRLVGLRWWCDSLYARRGSGATAKS